VNQPTEAQIKHWETVLERDAPSECAWMCTDKAIVCFYNYTSDDIELAIVGNRGWANRKFITQVFCYTYYQLECRRCTVRVAASNLKSLKLVTKLGFKAEGVLREALNGEDCIILGMLKNECKWIRGK